MLGMKYIFVALLLFTTVVLIVFGFIIRNVSKSALKNSVYRLLITAVAMLLVYIMAITTNSERAALVFYGIFYIIVAVLLFCLAVYMQVYTKVFSENRWFKWIVIAGIVADSVCMALNVHNKNVFTCVLTTDNQGNFFYNVNSRENLYLVHMALCYVLIFFSGAALIYRLVKCPKIFRAKYRIILGFMLVTLFVNAVYLNFGKDFDFSLFFYALLGIAIVYFSFFHIPRGLMESLLAFAVKNMGDGIICFDINGKCIYANEMACKLFRVEGDWSVIEQHYRAWMNRRSLIDVDDCSWSESYEVDGEKQHFQAYFKKLYDDSHIIGSFYLMYDNTEDIRKLETEHYRATHDVLTGLYNEEYFYDRVKKLLDDNPNTAYDIVCSDIKDFKMVNDIYGFDKGNEMLVKIADGLRFNAQEGAIYGRLSADKFAICLPKERFIEETFLEQVTMIERVVGTGTFRVKIYVGVYEDVDRSLDVSVMCDRVKLAIQSVKGNYDGTIVYYDENLRERALEEQQIINEFNEAISDGQFQIYLQPQVSVDGVVRGGEALVRWIHPQKGMISPGTFIGLFERTGLISRLDLYIWELACKQLKEWKEKGYGDYYISVNISPRDFYFLDIYKIFTELVEKYEIDRHNLKLEITETAVMTDLKKQVELIEQLRSYGFILEMDDFGSGYSSLNMLKNIHMDTLKMDMGFLRKTDNTERSKSIIRTVIRLSKRLGMEVITEGVETREQIDLLTQMGCDLFQGYYFSKPMKISEYEERYFKQ